MENHLSAKIRRYFEKRGNRYVFRNGMSLNELAIESEIESATLSRAISGGRGLNSEQVHAFCRVLGLDERERWELQHAAAVDHCERIGFEIALSTNPFVVEMLVMDAARVDQAIESGAIDLALDLLADLYGRYTAIDGDEYPTVPMIRVLSLAQMQRSKLMAALHRRKIEDECGPRILWDFREVGETLRLAEIMSGTELEVRLWRMRYIDAMTIGEIAVEENLTEETVLSVLEVWKQRLLRRIAEDPTDGQESEQSC